MDHEKNTLAMQRGQRVKGLRNALGLSRQKFADKFGFTKSTIQNWEDARHSGLTDTGARKIVKALAQEDIHLTTNWLMDGLGEPPVFPDNPLLKTSKPFSSVKLTEAQIIQQELAAFHRLNQNTIDIIVPDDKMKPFYYQGDVVAGQRYFDPELAKLKCLDLDCIVQTLEGEILIRYVQKGAESGLYDLYCYNEYAQKVKTHKNIRIFSVAPILWIRRRAPFY